MEPEDQQSNGTQKVRRKRGTGFPVVPLPEAARIIAEAGKHGSEHTMQAFAEYMGHSTTNSGAFRQRFAALRDWDLIAGSGEQVELSELGRELAYEENPDTRRRVLRRAFMRCAVFTRIYEESAKNADLDISKIGSRAVLSHGVAPESRSAFVKSFVESAIEVGLASRVDEAQIRLLSSDDHAALGEDHPDATEQGRPADPESQRRAASPVLLRHPWQIAGGEIILEVRSTRSLPPRAFAALGGAVERLEALARLLSTGDSDPIATELD